MGSAPEDSTKIIGVVGSTHFVNFVPSGDKWDKTYFLSFLSFCLFVFFVIPMTFDKYDKSGCADTAWPVFSPGRILQRGETRDTSPWHSGVSIPYLADGNQDCFGKCTSRVFTHGSTSQARGKRNYLEVQTCGTRQIKSSKRLYYKI